MLNWKESSIQDKELQEYLQTKELDLVATTDGEEANSNADFVVVSTPTNYDPKKNYFDTSSVENVIEQVMKLNQKVYIIVKSILNTYKYFGGPNCMDVCFISLG